MVQSDFIFSDGFADLPESLRGGIAAIGNFDGCHRGHQAVFDEARDMARDAGVPLVMVTFEPHPRDVFAPEPFLFRLSVTPAKKRLAEALGFDGLVVAEFTRELAAVEAGDFVDRFLVGALGVRGVVVGGDFQFGRARKGTPEFLRECGARSGFDVREVKMLESGVQPVSSSRVRTSLADGDLDAANRLLGYHLIIEGTVVHGDHRGRELGFPTANFALAHNFGMAQGIYAVIVRLGGRLFGGAASYGKPMFDNRQPPFEVHIFDFDEDIYGELLEVALISPIRGQMTFDGLEGLIAQMKKDCEAARAALARVQPLSELDRKLGFIIQG